MRQDVHKTFLCNTESIGVDMYILIYFYCAQRTKMYVGTNMTTKIHISPAKMHVTNIYVNTLHVSIGIRALKPIFIK